VEDYLSKMRTLRNKTTGETIQVDESELGNYIKPPTTGTTSGLLGDYATGDNSDTLRQFLLFAALSDPKNASKFGSIASLIPEKSETEKKTITSKQKAEEIMTMLEDLYYQSPSGLLAYGRADGLNEYAKMLAGENPDLANYISQRQSIRPTLARALGDVGNLSKTEQEAAVKGIPTGFSTPEEAEKFFASSRVKFGLKKRDLSKISGGAIEKKGTTVGGLTFGGEEGTTTPTKTKKPSGPMGERLNVPVPALAGGLTKMAGTFAKNPALAVLLGGGGEWFNQLREKGIPLTREQGTQDWGAPSQALGMLAGPLGLAATSPTSRDVMKSGATTGLLSLLLHPLQTLGGIRGGLLNRAVSGGAQLPGKETILTGAEKFVSKGARPEQLSTARKLFTEDVSKFAGGGKFSITSLLEELAKRGEGAFKSGQTLKASNAAAYNAAVRDSLRTALNILSPTAGKITSAMGQTYKIGGLTKELLKILAYGGIGAGAAYGVGKAMGRD
jgi:hypothetical protein